MKLIELRANQPTFKTVSLQLSAYTIQLEK